MDSVILERLSAVTDEEREYLAGRTDIDRDKYVEGREGVISANKLMGEGKLITVRPHTRFVRFPEHSHDYVEMVYMVEGSTTHLINGASLTLDAGDLLILGQDARQEIMPAGERDIAVNFIVRPEFFSATLPFLGSEETPLRDFITRCIVGDSPTGYLLFRVAEVKPVQNLIENLIWTVITDTPNKRSINQLTMGLLFVQLMNHTDRLTVGSREQETMVRVLSYIEERYQTGTLTEIASILHYDTAWLSRDIKRRTGKNFTELMQEKRLSQAAWFLRNTDQNVSDIAVSVGYENVSYFHRIFAARYGMSPRAYRTCK